MSENVPSRIRELLSDLAHVRDNLLALSDDIWLSVDHNDNAALEKAVEFKKTYNQKMAAFDSLAEDLSHLIEDYTQVARDEDHETADDDGAGNERIIRELDRHAPHGLGEDLRYKRPFGFVLAGKAYKNVTTWRRLYELVCLQLARRDPKKFATLPAEPVFISNRKNHAFARSPKQLRAAAELTDGVYAEVNRSANGLRDNMKLLLQFFGLKPEDAVIYLRQDRDAKEGSNT